MSERVMTVSINQVLADKPKIKQLQREATVSFHIVIKIVVIGGNKSFFHVKFLDIIK